MTNFSTTTKIVKSRHRAIVLFYSIFQKTGHLTEKTWERSSAVLVVSTRKKWANYWLKTYQLKNKQEYNLADDIHYLGCLENICRAEQLFTSETYQ